MFLREAYRVLKPGGL
ncbi:hypothetical protein [Aeropyrum pernix]